MPLKKAWNHLISNQQWENCRTDWVLLPCLGIQSKKKKTLNSNKLKKWPWVTSYLWWKVCLNTHRTSPGRCCTYRILCFDKNCQSKRNKNLHWLIRAVIGLMSRMFANGLWDWGSTPSRVIPKTQKMVLDATLLNTQHYKVRIQVTV